MRASSGEMDCTKPRKNHQQQTQQQQTKSCQLEKLDVIIFGASGNLGRYVVEHAAEVLGKTRWGVAGRDKKKLEEMLRELDNKTDVNLSNIPIYVANVRNMCSLEKMTSMCRVLINCVGPYQELGEAVITACLTTATHVIDAANTEPLYMECVQLKYNGLARTQRVYVIPACGWASFPIDVGTAIIKKQFQGTINSIEAYTEYWSPDLGLLLNSISGLTAWKSIILGCKNIKHIPFIRKKLHSNPLPQLKPKVSYKGIFHYSKAVGRICISHPIDQQVVERSQYYFYHQENRRPIQFRNYLAFSSKLMALLMFIWFFIIALLAQIEYTRNILLKYPALFSLGTFTQNGPDKACMDKLYFRITFKVNGWASDTSTPPDQMFAGEPCKEMHFSVSGTNPWYGTTSICLLSAALSLLEDSRSMPSVGGVYTPGAAFANTNIENILSEHDNGLRYRVV